MNQFETKTSEKVYYSPVIETYCVSSEKGFAASDPWTDGTTPDDFINHGNY